MGASERIDELRKRYDENQRRFFAPLANEYRKAGDLEQAIGLCRLHLADAPSNLSGQIVFGQALFDAGNLDEARATFETAIGLDPENLIALRHLGDIARAQSDVPSARQWYQRVLDADRRNEEVLALMAGLTSLGTASAPSAEQGATGAEPPTGISAPATPVTPPRSGPPASGRVLASAPRASTASLIGIDFDEPTQDRTPTPLHGVPQIVEPAAVEVKPVDAAEPEFAGAAEAPESVAPPAEPGASEEMVRAAAESETVEFPVVESAPAQPSQVDAADFGMVDDAAREAPPESSPAHPTPMSSFGFDVDLGAASHIPVATERDETPDFGVVELLHDAPSQEAPQTGQESGFSETVEITEQADEVRPELDDEPSAGSLMELVPEPAPESVRQWEHESAEADISQAYAEPVAEPVPESVAESAAEPVAEPVATEVFAEAFEEPFAEPVAADAQAEAFVELVAAEPLVEALAEPAAEPVAPAVPVEAFATETMAELYVRQGLRHEAIAVYRQLVDARPGEAALRMRLAELEDEHRAAPEPTARAFFGKLSSRRWPAATATAFVATPTFLIESVPPADSDARAAMPARPEAAPTPASTPAAPEALADAPVEKLAPDAAPAGGTLGALFGESPVSRYDDAATQALSAAFRDEPPKITGRPARTASGEVSLDQIFSSTPPAPDSGSETPPSGTASKETGDVSKQLNSWLDDLEKP